MAVTVTIVSRQRVGALNLHIHDVTMDSSYAGGGGEPLSAQSLGHKSVFVSFVERLVSGFVGSYDRAAAKFAVYNQGVTTGAAAAAATGTGSFIVDASGAESAQRAPNTVPATTYSFGGLKEVPATTDLSAVTFRIVTLGR